MARSYGPLVIKLQLPGPNSQAGAWELAQLPRIHRLNLFIICESVATVTGGYFLRVALQQQFIVDGDKAVGGVNQGRGRQRGYAVDFGGYGIMAARFIQQQVKVAIAG